MTNADWDGMLDATPPNFREEAGELGYEFSDVAILNEDDGEVEA